VSNEIRVTKNDDGSYSLSCSHYGMIDGGGEFNASLAAQSMKELPGKIEELFKMREDSMSKGKKKGPKTVTDIKGHLGCGCKKCDAVESDDSDE